MLCVPHIQSLGLVCVNATKLFSAVGFVTVLPSTAGPSIPHLVYMTSRGRGQSAKTLKEKVEILCEVDCGKTSKLEIARKHGIPKSTLSTYIKNKRAIEEAYATDAFTGSRKRLRSAKHPELERAVLTWIKETRSQNIPLSGPIVMAKAANFALRLNIDDFKASEGWLHRFRERHEIVFRTVSGEGKEVNSETCAKWQSGALQELLQEYSPRDIFNADETALFYKLLPSKTLTYKGDTCAGGKRSKERVTVLVAANMDGTEKLPLLIIGKALKPRCFKNIRTLPAEYTANSKAWMTREIFKQWLIKLDRKFELAHRSVLLVVDNCSAHVVDVDLKAIKLSFLPPNTTAALQPMDQGVIKNLKCFYRRHMLERLVLCAAGTKGYDVTLLSAMHMLVRAWDQVTATTVANCFRHSGFCVAIEGTAGELDEREADVIPAGLRDALGDVNFGDYVDADRSAVVCGTITDDDIIAQVTGEEALVVDVGEDEEDEAPTRPTASEVMEAMRVARLFFSFEEDEEDAFRHVRALENKAMAITFKERKQKVITDYFRK